MAEVRTIVVHPNIIFDLVFRQAGTLGKALLEYVMNAVDAEATRCDIEVTSERVSIVDDGRGFRSKNEIAQWFDNLGFPHDAPEAQRKFGQFGIGRAQLWAFASTVWETGAFRLDVDVKQRGMDYELDELKPPVKGTRIEGPFYEALKSSELLELERELTDLAYYVSIPVHFNGRLISHEPSKEKWDCETDDAWMRIKESGELKVYNLGALVRRYPGYNMGCGGVVVTKPGVRLKLNTARNDILASCEVWRRIKRFAQSKADARMEKKQTRLSEAELENAAKRLLAGDLLAEQGEKIRLVTDINGRGYTLRQFVLRSSVTVTVAQRGSRLGGKVHDARVAFVLAPITLERFDVETPTQFKKKLLNVLKRQPTLGDQRRLGNSKFVDRLEDVAANFTDTHEVVPPKAWTKAERIAVCALSTYQYRLLWAMREAGVIEDGVKARHLGLGKSDTAEMWTDGREWIWIERDTLKLMKHGLSGVQAVINILVHEYLHDEADTGSHQHDTEFLERYHNFTCSREYGEMDNILGRVFRYYVGGMHRAGIKLGNTILRHLDDVEATQPNEEEPIPPDGEKPQAPAAAKRQVRSKTEPGQVQLFG